MTRPVIILCAVCLLVCVLLGFDMADGVGGVSARMIKSLYVMSFNTEIVRWNWVRVLAMFCIFALVLLAYAIEPHKENFLLSKSIIVPVVGLVLYLTVAQFMLWLLYNNNINEVWALKSTLFGAPIFLMVIGNYLSVARKSWFSGWPTPWSMKSDLAWEKSHRLLGRGFVLLSLCLGVCFLMFDDYVHWLTAYLYATGVFLVSVTIYSWYIWKNDPKRESVFSNNSKL